MQWMRQTKASSAPKEGSCISIGVRWRGMAVVDMPMCCRVTNSGREVQAGTRGTWDPLAAAQWILSSSNDEYSTATPSISSPETLLVRSLRFYWHLRCYTTFLCSGRDFSVHVVLSLWSEHWCLTPVIHIDISPSQPLTLHADMSSVRNLTTTVVVGKPGNIYCRWQRE